MRRKKSISPLRRAAEADCFDLSDGGVKHGVCDPSMHLPYEGHKDCLAEFIHLYILSRFRTFLPLVIGLRVGKESKNSE
jgi:hypothetical protein